MEETRKHIFKGIHGLYNDQELISLFHIPLTTLNRTEIKTLGEDTSKEVIHVYTKPNFQRNMKWG